MSINKKGWYLRSHLQRFYNAFGTNDAKLPERAIFMPHFPMQKFWKMVVRMSVVVIWPVIVARWWRVSRRSWARRSAGVVVRRPSRRARAETAAERRASAWRALVMRMASSSPAAVSRRAVSAIRRRRSSSPWPVRAEMAMEVPSAAEAGAEMAMVSSSE